MEKRIAQKIEQEFSEDFYALLNESSGHALGRTDSHFKLTLVSDKFANLNKVKRHQLIYKLLAEEMAVIHALALHLYTPEEWAEVGEAPASPKCAG